MCPANILKKFWFIHSMTSQATLWSGSPLSGPERGLGGG